MKAKNVRLSNDIIPVRYKISLTPDLANFTFKGSETIDLILSKPTRAITLHSAELEVSAESARSISYDIENETATINLEKPLSKGKHKLKLEFTGILNDKMRGFYRSKYSIGKKDHYMAVTQFESTDARRAFPCFDEPDKKAIFDVELVIPNDHMVISNTVETEVLEHESGYKVVRFTPSPKMSTYLLAFIVGKFEFIEAKTKEGVLVRVFVTPGKKKQAKFALETATKILSFYSNYFKIAYPLPTLDLIAIPDFAAGAMENWGAVTYRETALLVDEELSSTANKQWVALVIAHELAHMWFGNLVTMQWWTHLWLNEGFASYIEYLAVDHLFSKWDVWTQFVYMDHSRALELDGLENTHPIEVEVNHPKEISEIFDAVSYSKGASVIRMLASYLGEESFQKSLQVYLKKYQYSNAKTTDLWAAMEKVSKKPVETIMKNWTGEPGYPLLEISEMKDKLLITQSRYFSSPISAIKSKDKTIWSVPISLISENKKIEHFLVSKKTMTVRKPFGWFKLNPGEASFARVNYPADLLDLLQKPILENKLGTEDRFGIVRDVFALSQSGQANTADLLKMVDLFKGEESYIVWMQIASALKTISNLVAREPFYESYKSYCREVFRPIVERTGWEKKKGEDHSVSLLRSVVINMLGINGDKKTIARAKDLFNKSRFGKIKLDADLRGVVYNLVAENGAAKEYEILHKLYKDSPMQEEKDRLLRALCAFKNKELLKKTLDLAFSGEMRAQDQFKVVSFVWGNPEGADLSWGYVKKNWKKIVKRFGGGHLYSRFIQPATFFVESKNAREIESFFKKNSAEGLERTIAQVVEQIDSNALWIARDRKNLSSFLQSFK